MNVQSNVLLLGRLNITWPTCSLFATTTCISGSPTELRRNPGTTTIVMGHALVCQSRGAEGYHCIVDLPVSFTHGQGCHWAFSWGRCRRCCTMRSANEWGNWIEVLRQETAGQSTSKMTQTSDGKGCPPTLLARTHRARPPPTPFTSLDRASAATLAEWFYC